MIALRTAKVLSSAGRDRTAADAAKTERTFWRTRLTTRFIRISIRSDGERHAVDLLFVPEILIGAVDPVGARWSEDIEVNGIFKGLGLVRHVRGNAQHFAGVNCNFLAVDPELQCAIEDVGDLLVMMAVLRDNTSLFEKHAGQHNFLSDYELPLQQRVQFFQWNCVPGNVLQRRWARTALRDGLLRAGMGLSLFYGASD